MPGTKMVMTGEPEWRDAEDICTFADCDRHLGHIVNTGGHIVNTGEWEAFDAIHPNDTGDGFRRLGVFPTVSSAKTAVERAVSQSVEVVSKGIVSSPWIS